MPYYFLSSELCAAFDDSFGHMHGFRAKSSRKRDGANSLFAGSTIVNWKQRGRGSRSHPYHLMVIIF